MAAGMANARVWRVGSRADIQGVEAHRVSVWRVLRNLNLTQKKDLRAVEQKRPEVVLARQVWISRRQPFMRNMLTPIGVVDVEAGKAIDPGDRFPRRACVKTNMAKTNKAKTTGWAPCGARLIDHALRPLVTLQQFACKP